MNRQLELYISRATRGLYGAKKLEVQAELRGSIEARIWQLEMQGNTNALETAVSEMGAASSINSGLFKEHVMPSFSKAVFAAIAATALTIAGISSSQAQVGWAESNFLMVASNGNGFCSPLYIRIVDLKTILEKAGATVVESLSKPLKSGMTETCQFPFPDRMNLNLYSSTWQIGQSIRTWDITFQSGNKSYQIQLQAPKSSLDANGQMAKSPEEAEFIPLYELLNAFKSTNLPIRFEGWQRPNVQLGDFGFTFDRPDQPFNPVSVYMQTFIEWIYEKEQAVSRFSNPISGTFNTNPNHPFRHAIRTNAPANTVFAILTTQGGFTAPKGGGAAPSYLAIARTNNQGILEFRSKFKHLEFSKSRQVTK